MGFVEEFFDELDFYLTTLLETVKFTRQFFNKPLIKIG